MSLLSLSGREALLVRYRKAMAETQDSGKEKELTREEKLALEEKAIEALITMGVKFQVPLRIQPKQAPWWIRWWNKHFPNHLKVWRDKRISSGWEVSVEEVPNADMGRMEQVYMRNFHVKPLFLGTIDVLRKLYLQIEYDEEKIQEEPIQETKKLFKYIPLLAEIAAVAVINDPLLVKPDGSKEVRKLQQFFVENLTVNRLRKLADVISQMMNPGGFTSSIRSIMEIGTTKPKADLIEKKAKGKS